MERVATGQSLGDREKQEDAVRVARQSADGNNSDLLMLLSDGMGGHAGGEIASNLALDTFKEHFENGSTNMRPRGRLQESLEAANEAIAAEVARNPELKGMGCTLVGVLVAAGRLVWVSVGDSILFLLRHGQLRRLNANHSYFGELLELVERGEISLQEAEAHPKKNALLSVLTGAPIKMVDLNVIETDPGDVLILASDGLETLSDDDIARIAQANASKGPSAISDALLNAVKGRGRPRQDNTSIIVMQHSKESYSAYDSNSKWNLQPDASAKLPMVAIAAATGGAVITGAIVAWALWPSEPEPVPDPKPAAEDAATIEGPTEIRRDEGTEITDGTESDPDAGVETTPDAENIPDASEQAPEDGTAPDSEGDEGASSGDVIETPPTETEIPPENEDDGGTAPEGGN